MAHEGLKKKKKGLETLIDKDYGGDSRIQAQGEMEMIYVYKAKESPKSWFHL